MTHISITAESPVITFIQLWQMESIEQQQRWLQVMHENIHLLQSKPGFQSMVLHPSLDGKNMVVYAQWISDAYLTHASTDSEVKSAREKLDSHGKPEGTIYRVDSVVLPSSRKTASIDIENPATYLTFFNIWTTQKEERQQNLLAAMKAEADVIVAKPGSRGMAFHNSLDGSHLAVYAQWDNEEAFASAIANDNAAMENRQRLSQWGEPAANIYRVDALYLASGSEQ